MFVYLNEINNDTKRLLNVQILKKGSYNQLRCFQCLCVSTVLTFVVYTKSWNGVHMCTKAGAVHLRFTPSFISFQIDPPNTVCLVAVIIWFQLVSSWKCSTKLFYGLENGTTAQNRTECV